MNTITLSPNVQIGRLVLRSAYTPPAMPFDLPTDIPVTLWDCVCECGAETRTTDRKLLTGQVEACAGCNINRKKDRLRRLAKPNGVSILEQPEYAPAPGDTLGLLTLVEPEGNDKWKVQCRCGNELTVSNRLLFSKSKALRRCGSCH